MTNKPQQFNQNQHKDTDSEKIFFDIKIKEIDLQSKNIELNHKQLDYMSETAKLQLQINKDNAESERKHKRIVSTRNFLFAGFVSLLIVGLIICCLFIDKEEFAIEIMKIIAYCTVGVFGGYFYGKSSVKNKT